jgi:hypothetical protein
MIVIENSHRRVQKHAKGFKNQATKKERERESEQESD